MNRGPTPGRVRVDHVAKARSSRNHDLPDFILVVAERANQIGLRATGEILAYSPSVISEVISGTYRGDLVKFERVVRGKLLGETIQCPGLGKVIGTDRCRGQQKRPFSSSSPMAARLFEACRTCPNREVKS